MKSSGGLVAIGIFIVLISVLVFFISSFSLTTKKTKTTTTTTSGSGGGSSVTPGSGSGGGSSVTPGSGSGILQGCFPNSSYSTVDEEGRFDKIEQILKAVLESVAPFVLQIVAESILAKSLNAIDKISILRDELKNSKDFAKQFAKRRGDILMKANSKYKIVKMLRYIKPRHLAKLGKNVSKYLRVLATENPAIYQQVITESIQLAAARSGRQITQEAVEISARESAERIANRFALRAAQNSAMGPAGIAELIVSVAGIVLDETNTGNMQNIQNQKTSDLLAKRENEINQLKDLNLQAYRDAYSTAPPSSTNINFSVIGPFLKYEIDDFEMTCLIVETKLLLLPGGPTYSTGDLKIINALGGENSPQIQRIRSIQNKIFMDYYLKVQCLPAKPVCHLEGNENTPQGTFSETGTFNVNDLKIYQYSKTPKDFAPGASFMFTNPGLPENKNFYLKINNTHTAFITGFISCSSDSPIVFGGYFIDNQGNEMNVPTNIGTITSLKIGTFSPARPACSSPLPIPSPIPLGCLFQLFKTSILTQLTDNEQDDIHKFALQYMCKEEGGKFIATTGECSYSDARSCHTSYTWPPPILGTDTPSTSRLQIPNISSIITLNNDVYLADSARNIILKLADDKQSTTIWTSSGNSPIISGVNLQTPVSMAIKDVDFYIANRSGRITKIENFNCNFRRTVINDWVTLSTGTPIIDIEIIGPYMYVLLQDRIVRITLMMRRIVDKWASNGSDSTVTLSINQPLCMTSTSSDLFIAKGNQISRISNVTSAFGTNNVIDNWASNNSNAIIRIGESFDPRSMLVIEDTKDGSGEMYIGTNNKIIKISNCFSQSSYSVNTRWNVFDSSPSPTPSTINTMSRLNKDLLAGNGTSIIVIGSALPWDTKSFENPNQDPSDYNYGEWRTDFNLLYKDLGIDLSNDVTAKGGVCVQWDPSHRLMCNSLTKATAGGETGTNSYNIMTGECTNDPSFCRAYGYSYDRQMPTSKMANRGSGPLPSCYQNDGQKALAFIFGETLSQYLTMFFNPTPAFTAFVTNRLLYALGATPSAPGVITAIANSDSAKYAVGTIIEATTGPKRTVEESQRSCSGCDPYTYYSSGLDACLHKDVDPDLLTKPLSASCPSGFEDNGVKGPGKGCTRWDETCTAGAIKCKYTKTRCHCSKSKLVTKLPNLFCPSGYERDDLLCKAIKTDVDGGCDGRNPRKWDEVNFHL